jgi:hypothetical protein
MNAHIIILLKAAGHAPEVGIGQPRRMIKQGIVKSTGRALMRKSTSSKIRMENLVVVYKTQGRQEEAIELFSKLGLIFLSKSRENEAKKMFEGAGFYSKSLESGKGVRLLLVVSIGDAFK